MKRDIFESLNQWKNSARRKPLVLQGARQVGKTYALENFGHQAYDNFIRLNFESTPSLKQFFEEDLNPQRIIKQLAIHYDMPIKPATTLLIFDEIQECPNALNSLKYFNEAANEYHVCAAGSLLGVMLARAKGFPVGKVNFLQLRPMKFMEFLDASGESRLKNYIQSLDAIAPLPLPFHNKLNNLLKIYLFTGGMPEVVSTYIKSEDVNAVRAIQQEIIKSYTLDFSKHTASAQAMKISQVWHSIPSQLAKENKKFLYSVVRKSARAREYEEALQWLDETGIVKRIYNIKTPRLPIKAYADLEIFKLYLLDVGILNTLANLKPKLVVQGNQLFQEFKGSLTENYVLQELLHLYDELFYWSSQGRAEVDFVLPINSELYPLEVKSGTSERKRSLRVYGEKYQPKHLLRTSMLNLKLDKDILNIPLYLIGEIKRLLTSAAQTNSVRST